LPSNAELEFGIGSSVAHVNGRARQYRPGGNALAAGPDRKHAADGCQLFCVEIVVGRQMNELPVAARFRRSHRT
jgi:hypothetical protein